MDQTEHQQALVRRIAHVPGTLSSRRQVLQSGISATAGVAIGSLINPLAALAASNHTASDDIIVRFSRLAGVQPPFLGDAGLAHFRGVHGGPLPGSSPKAAAHCARTASLIFASAGWCSIPPRCPRPPAARIPSPSSWQSSVALAPIQPTPSTSAHSSSPPPKQAMPTSTLA